MAGHIAEDPMTTAKGIFTVSLRGEDPLQTLEGDIRLTHASGTQRFSGDIVGDGSIDWLIAYRADRSAHMVGLQRITGTVNGQAGAVVIAAIADHDGAASRATWTIVEGSGSGQLVGISGRGTFVASGATVDYELEYEIDPHP
jgi:hypothetical protein